MSDSTPSNKSCIFFLLSVLSDTYSVFPACAYLREMRVTDEVEIEKFLCTTENVRLSRKLESKKA